MITVDDVRAEIIRRYCKLDEYEKNCADPQRAMSIFAAIKELERLEYWIENHQEEPSRPRVVGAACSIGKGGDLYGVESVVSADHGDPKDWVWVNPKDI